MDAHTEAGDKTLPLVGIMVGGKGSRMGGRNKALLTRPDGQTLLGHLLGVCAATGLECVLVGGAHDWSEIAPGVPLLADEPAGVGPMGGLGALLGHAVRCGHVSAILLATDMPDLSVALLRRLASAPSQADVLAGQDPKSSKWFPFFARYCPARVLPAVQEGLTGSVRSFQTLFRGLSVERLPLDADELAQLRDWDTPEDLVR